MIKNIKNKQIIIRLILYQMLLRLLQKQRLG